MADITQRGIDQFYSDHHRNHGGAKEDYFGVLYLMREFHLDLETALAQTTFGNNDYGIDGFHFDPSTGNLYLYQFKWSNDHNLFRDSLRRITDDGMKRIFDRGQPHDPLKNPVLVKLNSLLHEKGPAIRGLFVHFIFRGNPDATEKSSTLEKLREDLEAKKYLMDDFFGREISFVVEFRSTAGRVAGRHQADKTHRYALHFSQAGMITGPNGEHMITGFARLNDLRQMYREMKQRLFDRNIRSALSDDEAPNRSLRKTFAQMLLEGKTSPMVFPFHHNGVTVSAQHFGEDAGVWQVVEPRVLNGAQTISTFSAFCEEHREDSRFRRNSPLLEEILIPCRIILHASDAFVAEVTINNNRQNPVMPWALRANDEIQLELEDKFRDELKMMYQRQEGAFQNLTIEDLEERGISSDHSKAVEMKKLAATFLACDGEVDKVSRLKEVFENERSYLAVFTKKRLDADVRCILLAYKVERKLNSFTNTILERGEKRYQFVRRGRNMLWALLIQGLFNDAELAERLEAGAGSSLVMDAGLTEWMGKIAVNKVRLILSDMLTVERYQEQINQERYEFLRTKAAFETAMGFAHKRFKWVVKKL